MSYTENCVVQCIAKVGIRINKIYFKQYRIKKLSVFFQTVYQKFDFQAVILHLFHHSACSMLYVKCLSCTNKDYITYIITYTFCKFTVQYINIYFLCEIFFFAEVRHCVTTAAFLQVHLIHQQYCQSYTIHWDLIIQTPFSGANALQINHDQTSEHRGTSHHLHSSASQFRSTCAERAVGPSPGRPLDDL